MAKKTKKATPKKKMTRDELVEFLQTGRKRQSTDSQN